MRSDVQPPAGYVFCTDSAGASEDELCRALTDLFVALRAPIYRYLLVVLNNRSEAEDLTQEAFIRLFRHLRAENAVRDPRAWLFATAHNLAMDAKRRVGRTGQILDLEDSDESDPRPDVECSLLERERLEAFKARLDRLTPQERQCVQLRTEGLRYREIGEVLGIRIPSVQSALARAVRKLRGRENA